MIPTRLKLKKEEHLEIDWSDGQKCVYSISYLRSLCPCAQCRMVREGSDPHTIEPVTKPKPLLTILPGNYSGQLTVTHAEMVGKYAIKLVFSDQHETGIYSFEYLREICPKPKRESENVKT
jgi:DUF971 family protein